MRILKSFRDDETEIYLFQKKIEGTLDLSRFTKLEQLHCRNNYITGFCNLPNTLKILDCYGNNITELDNLPNSLIELW